MLHGPIGLLESTSLDGPARGVRIIMFELNVWHLRFQQLCTSIPYR